MSPIKFNKKPSNFHEAQGMSTSSHYIRQLLNPVTFITEIFIGVTLLVTMLIFVLIMTF